MVFLGTHVAVGSVCDFICSSKSVVRHELATKRMSSPQSGAQPVSQPQDAMAGCGRCPPTGSTAWTRTANCASDLQAPSVETRRFSGIGTVRQVDVVKSLCGILPELATSVRFLRLCLPPKIGSLPSLVVSLRI